MGRDLEWVVPPMSAGLVKCYRLCLDQWSPKGVCARQSAGVWEENIFFVPLIIKIIFEIMFFKFLFLFNFNFCVCFIMYLIY